MSLSVCPKRESYLDPIDRHRVTIEPMHNADLTIRNARIFTGASTIEGSVSMSKGRIAGVGEGVGDPIAGTEVIDASGALVTPGFTDAHVHTATSGLDKLRLNFDDCSSSAEAIAAVGQYADDHPDDEWLLGAGWSQAWFERGCPNAKSLDQVIGDRPAIFMNRDGHGAWVSSRALQIAGIDATTPDPADGRIERLRDGTPQGTLQEGAVTLVDKHAPNDTLAELEAGLLRGQSELLSYGITGWQDAAVMPVVQEAYLNVARSGKLIGDVVGALWWDRHRGLEQVANLVERRKDSAPGFRPTSVKLMLDGVAENYTASILDSYLDLDGKATGNRGVDFIDPEELKTIVIELDRNGFQCHFHALGDRAVRQALDAVEAAKTANGSSDHRHHLAHLQFVHPDDRSRFVELGAVANAQPLWACNDDYQVDLTQPFITEERYTWQYPFGSIAATGAVLAMGSDWNVSTADVMKEIQVAITRQSPEGNPPLGIEERLTPEQSLRAFTWGSAFVNHSESERGTIEVGKVADLVVLDHDPLVDGTFGEASVKFTIAAGRPVYEG